MLTIKQEVLENVISVLTSVTGEKVQVGMDALARLVRENEGNDLMEHFTEECKKMQLSYNEKFVVGTSALLTEYDTMDEFREHIARAAANMSNVKRGSTDIAADKIDLPEI